MDWCAAIGHQQEQQKVLETAGEIKVIAQISF